MLCSFGVIRILSLKFGGKFKIIGGDRYTFNLFLQVSPMIKWSFSLHCSVFKIVSQDFTQSSVSQPGHLTDAEHTCAFQTPKLNVNRTKSCGGPSSHLALYCIRRLPRFIRLRHSMLILCWVLFVSYNCIIVIAIINQIQLWMVCPMQPFLNRNAWWLIFNCPTDDLCIVIWISVFIKSKRQRIVVQNSPVLGDLWLDAKDCIVL